MGFLEKPTRETFHVNVGNYTNSVLPLHGDAKRNWSGHIGLESVGIIECEFTTLDHFVEEQGLTCIDILKLDVQGSEFRALAGAENSMKSGVIDVIKCEVMMTETYEGQKPLHYYLKLFDDWGFDVINICDPAYRDSGDLINVDVILKRH